MRNSSCVPRGGTAGLICGFWNKVQKHWKSALAGQEKEVTKVDPADGPELEVQLPLPPLD